ncbi:uncharacterized protein Dvar_37930 [Desulfosarcina variabilis str. Montpellier]|uniref:hypothetical protein n=1 Tax=Desulfosarcina variabilis TaxID=2300 RepID=UPI003AFAE680
MSSNYFLIPTSQSTVHKTLSKKGLVDKAKRKPVRNPSKPRFFERSSPNHLWQSDIMTFRLAGRNAYLIGFLDDNSRYITSLGLNTCWRHTATKRPLQNLIIIGSSATHIESSQLYHINHFYF